MGPKSSSRDVAIGLGISDRRVRQLAAELGLQKEGRDWRFNAVQAYALRARHRRSKIGRPKKEST